MGFNIRIKIIEAKKAQDIMKRKKGRKTLDWECFCVAQLRIALLLSGLFSSVKPIEDIQMIRGQNRTDEEGNFTVLAIY